MVPDSLFGPARRSGVFCLAGSFGVRVSGLKVIRKVAIRCTKGLVQEELLGVGSNSPLLVHPESSFLTNLVLDPV